MDFGKSLNLNLSLEHESYGFRLIPLRVPLRVPLHYTIRTVVFLNRFAGNIVHYVTDISGILITLLGSGSSREGLKSAPVFARVGEGWVGEMPLSTVCKKCYKILTIL